jgi:uncharacterized protein (DUF952 family)
METDKPHLHPTSPETNTMAQPDPLPTYVYKIHLPPPASLSTLSEIDRRDGFVHLSTAAQVPSTAARFFAQHGRLRLQKIELARIAARVRWEAAGHGGVFPHVYDDPLEGAIVGEGEVLEWERPEGESWVDAAARLEGLE